MNDQNNDADTGLLEIDYMDDDADRWHNPSRLTTSRVCSQDHVRVVE